MEPFWSQVNESSLRQGVLLPCCKIPLFPPDFAANSDQDLQRGESDLLLLTQSCDLDQQKVRLVAACPIHLLASFEANNPTFAKKGRWNEVLKGRIEGLHLLASPTKPEDPCEALVVDFREIYSLPFEYLVKRAEELGPGWRLVSPYLKHFSQAFARFFMRVGLPSPIPLFP